MNAFGIKDRGPAQVEAELMTRWFSEYGFSLDIILEACRRTISRTSKPNFPYADKILESWKQSGVKHMEDIALLDKPSAKPEKPASGNSGSSKNKFNDFPQRDYNFDQLEKKLLDC